jgi:hypothetical protein
MRAVDYVRVSADEQVTEGLSLHAQQARVTAYALLKAWDKLRRQVQETLGGLEIWTANLFVRQSALATVRVASSTDNRAKHEALTKGAKIRVMCFFFPVFLLPSSETRNDGI